jgi:hypothetical protein
MMWKLLGIALTLCCAAGGAVVLALARPEPTLIVDVTVEDGNAYHVHAPGAPFEVQLTARVLLGDAKEIGYQWVDERGRPLAAPVRMPVGEPVVVRSPFDAMPVGYYGLKLLPDEPEVLFNPGSGERREIGFGVLPPIHQRQVDPASPFGIVHFSYRDPYLNPGWMKTATEYQIGWDGSRASHDGWRERLAPAREMGQLELPIMLGDVWRSGSLAEIRRMMSNIFRADPRFDGDTYLPAYELGLEENLGSGDFSKQVLRTIQKLKTVQKERDKVDPSIRLAYQVANLGLGPYRAVMESGLAHEIDILSVHPYPWDDWPSPDEWHDDFIDAVRGIMAEHGVDLPIWYTEVGSAQNDAGVRFMYSGSLPVGDGQTRAEYAAYLVKLHAHALHKGVEKVFWYNYKDRGTSTTDSEAHFGLRDHWGHPKPGYLAYAAMLRCMKGRQPATVEASAGMRRYWFQGQGDACVVAWLEDDDEERTVVVSDLTGEATATLDAFDLMGTPLAPDPVGAVKLDTYPVFAIYATDR